MTSHTKRHVKGAKSARLMYSPRASSRRSRREVNITMTNPEADHLFDMKS